MAVEVVLMIPVLVVFMLLVVMGGRYVAVRADMEAAARDAARAASLERNVGDARSAAEQTANAALDGFASCRVSKLPDTFENGGIVNVELTCDVPLDGLGLLNIEKPVSMKANGSAPLDTYRRTE